MNSRSEIDELKWMNRELSTDVSILKQLVYMLNMELESRDSDKQDQLFVKNFVVEKDSNKIVNQNSEAEKVCANQDEVKVFESLLKSYQHSIEEKDQMLECYKNTFAIFSRRYKDIVLENTSLRQQLQETKIKTNTICDEWTNLHEEFQLLQEHNQLLTRQVKLHQNKLTDVQIKFKEALKEADVKVNTTIKKYEENQAELLMMKGRMSVLSEYNSDQTIQKISIDSYNAAVSELKSASVDFKHKMDEEIKTLKRKISKLESENIKMDIQGATITSERDSLQGYCSTLESENKNIIKKYEELNQEMESTRNELISSKKQIESCMNFIRELISVHNSLLKQRNDNNCV